ncbi:FeoA family protein [Ideonella sp.]|uniref:FeoA family protein n=1 Tax=Ideonella sp. TaxID=1929293 RepID=UPI002B48716A|nr:FeoA family protein [Ideonella sp.]HJV69449.1 FeoA family protein [Ideonella sp.]
MRAPTPIATSLDDLEPGDSGLIAEVRPPAELEAWAPWLTALGFEPGEPVRLISRARPGGDPLCVRVGGSTYALRRAEAACVRIWREVPRT